MCGIVGIVDLKERRTISPDLLRDMNDSLQHRGPDGFGTHIEPGVGLGHRRLSIIDLAGGKQPLYNADGTVVVTYNGEIYNFQELRSELEGYGHQFKTNCDTEVIVYAWQQWGARCVDRFNGMFAFAVWDQNKQTVFLARDRLGIKPLYYSLLPNGLLIFASELKSLLIHPDLPRQLDRLAVEDYFAFGYIPEPRTVLDGVKKLTPGHTITAKRGDNRLEPVEYWDLEIRPDGRDVDHAELLAELEQAVKRRLIADVPLGAFLSGGVDSSAVVATMAGLSADPVQTCSISFGDPEFNEAQFAQKVADQFSTAHHVKQVDPDDPALIASLPGIYDEPYADSSALPTYRVCQLAREKVTVALSGDGGDENFGGYRRYRWHVYEEKVRNAMPGFLRRGIFSPLGALYPKMDWAPKFLRAKSTLQALGRDSLAGYLHSVSLLPQNLRDKLFHKDFLNQLQGYQAIEVFNRYRDKVRDYDSLAMVQYLDFKTYLPGDILTKVDRASMAHALEVRVPLLDHTFVEYVARIGASQKLQGREGKYVFKKALEQKLTHETLYREKMGFAIPLATWFRGPLKEFLHREIFESGLQDSGIFDVDTLKKMFKDHQSGAMNYSSTLWALLMFGGSYRRIFS